uniref:non-specific serine/threonine protein kinase n=1 Tax=Manihot esculenta TaxID=3983 RepID=A0A2C9V6L4_MANES
MNIAEDKMASTESNSPSAPGEKQSVSPSQHTDLTESTSSENFQADTLRKFSYSELAEATNSFSNSVCLGGGTFGIVYRGCLPIGDFAVKKLYYTGDGQHIEEFENRINVIGMARHRHLVSLIGYCCEEYDRLLVLEFVPNRSLRFHLRDAERRSKLKWSKRMKIAIGSAKGLKYLHEYCEPKIIHGGIKSDNILLDRNFEPKVADFGLAILLEGYDAARIYVDSNISDLEKISELDIYSFGVTLLELITGRKIYEDEYIVKWARPLIIKRGSINVDYNSLVDSTLKGEYDQSEMERIIYCIAASVYRPWKLRPRMRQILKALEGVISHKELWIEYELITGRRNKDIVNWARPLMIKGDSINVDYDGLVDSTLKGQYDQSEVERIIYCIAASIYTPSSKLRPKMGQILKALEGLIPHQQLWAVEGSSEDFEAHGPRKFIFGELLFATDHFSNKNLIRIGDFGNVYEGILPNGEMVAIKKLRYFDEQPEEEFENQIMAVGKVRHPNLVRLIGYCCEGYLKFLVLEFIPNKSLGFHLSDTESRSNLKWSTRMKIAIESAKGLEYLHEHYPHSQIKANDIFLDENFTPKIVDFWHAEFFPKTDPRRISADRKEASIYTDLKISDSQSIFDRSEIYSFGVVLLELITGRRNKDIVNWARPLIIKGDSINVDYDGLVDSTLKGQYDQSEVERIIYCIAASIYTPSSKLRPKMGQILEALEGLIPHQQLWAVEGN